MFGKISYPLHFIATSLAGKNHFFNVLLPFYVLLEQNPPVMTLMHEQPPQTRSETLGSRVRSRTDVSRTEGIDTDRYRWSVTGARRPSAEMIAQIFVLPTSVSKGAVKARARARAPPENSAPR